MAFRLSSTLLRKFHPWFEKAFMKLSECNEFNAKRLETIGHSFMKLSVTDYCYHKKPDLDEGKWTAHRDNQMSISNLAKVGKEHGLDQMICSTDWLPDKYKLIGTGDNDTVKYSDVIQKGAIFETLDTCKDASFEFSDKHIATCVKSLIGTYLIFHGPAKTRKFLKLMGIDVITNKPKISEMNNENAHMIEILYQEKDFNKLESAISYQFKNRSLLIRAFTHDTCEHSSFIGTFEPLEFYGDAVLDYLITQYLYEYQMFYSRQILTDLRSSLTNNTIFASLSKEMQLSDYLFWNKKDILSHKIHADLYEYLAAAVYLDSGMNFAVTKRVFFNLMGSLIDEEIGKVSLKPIQKLMENYKPYRVTRHIDLDLFVVTIHYNGVNQPFIGKGNSFMNAQYGAAKIALNYFESLKKVNE